MWSRHLPFPCVKMAKKKRVKVEMAGTKCRWCISEMQERTTDRRGWLPSLSSQKNDFHSFTEIPLVFWFGTFMCNMLLLQLHEASIFTIHLQLSGSFHSCCCEVFIVSSSLSLTKTQQLQETITGKMTKAGGTAISHCNKLHMIMAWFSPMREVMIINP